MGEDDDHGDEAKAKAAAAPRPSAEGNHPQYIVAKVLSAVTMRKKKGSLLCELQAGAGRVPVVTPYENVKAGMKVILAPAGSEVCGKEVKRAKVAGEWTSGVICGPVEMGWPGDASRAVVVGDSPRVGDPAPAASGAGAAGEESASESEDGKTKAPSPRKAGNASRAVVVGDSPRRVGDPAPAASEAGAAGEAGADEPDDGMTEASSPRKSGAKKA
jgi:hypothetical protein